MKFATRVALVGRYGLIRYVHPKEAKSLLETKNVVRVGTGKLIDELTVPGRDQLRDVMRPSCNSLIPGYIEATEGGAVIEIDRPGRLTDDVVTEPSRTYKLKNIRKSERDIYRLSVTDHLSPWKPEYARL